MRPTDSTAGSTFVRQATSATSAPPRGWAVTLALWGLLIPALGAIGCRGQPPQIANPTRHDPGTSHHAPPGLLTEVELLLIKAGTPVPCDAEDPFGSGCPVDIPRGYTTMFRPGEPLIFSGPIAPGSYAISVTLYGDKWRGNSRVVQQRGTRRGVAFELDTKLDLAFAMRSTATGKDVRRLRVTFLAGGHNRDEDVCDLPSGWGDLCSSRKACKPPSPKGTICTQKPSTVRRCSVSLPGSPPRTFQAKGCELRALFIDIGNQICQAAARGRKRGTGSGIKQSELRRLIHCVPEH